MNCHVVIELEQSGSWRTPVRLKRRPRPRGEPGILARPVRLKTTAGDVLAGVTALPLAGSSVTSISCQGVLEFVRNDSGLVDEIARVLAPGGELRLRVPATGPLAGFDHLNLMHYLVDITRRGARPRETYEVGWRRHYGLPDLLALLDPGRFTIVANLRRGLILAEAVGFVASVLFRWFRPSHDRYRRARRLALAIERIEHQFRTPFGSVLEIRAIRLPVEGAPG